MVKAAFVGFGEVNTPIDIIINKCKTAEENLKKEGLDLISVYPITDDYEEKDIKKAIDSLKGKDFDCLVVCIAGWIPTHAVVMRAFQRKAYGALGALRLDGRGQTCHNS